MTNSKPSILVTGASCQIGHFLLPRLVQNGFQVNALSRNPPHQDTTIRWYRADIDHGEPIPVEADGLIHLAPLTLLPDLLPCLTAANLRRVIAFSSTSRYTKSDSADSKERLFVQGLITAEAALAAFCEPRSIAWTVFRPTLIYGCGKDKNVTAIARFLRRFRIFPLLGGEGGLRQPVHADDLAAACLQAWDTSASYNRGYNLSGGESLTYRAMVERIFHSEGIAPCFLPVPLAPFRLAVRAASLLPGYRYLSMEMVDRMLADLAFDHVDAYRDFGYMPRSFQPKPEGHGQ